MTVPEADRLDDRVRAAADALPDAGGAVRRRRRRLAVLLLVAMVALAAGIAAAVLAFKSAVDPTFTPPISALRIGSPSVLTAGAPVTAVAFSPDGELIAGATDRGNVRLWDAGSGKTIGRPMPALPPTTSIAFAPHGRQLAFAGIEGYVAVTDVATQRLLRAVDLDAPAAAVAFSPDASLLGAATLAGVHVLEPATGSSGVPIRGPALAVAFPTPETIAIAGTDGRLTVQDLAGGTLRFTHPTTSDPVSVAFGRLTFVASRADGAIGVWDIATGRRLAAIKSPRGDVEAVAIDPGERLVAAGGRSGIVRVWERRSGRAVATLTGHDGPVRDLAFDASGRALATASEDGTIRLWDVGGK